MNHRRIPPAGLLLLGFVLLCNLALGQVIRIDSTTYWKKAFRFGINVNQANFSDNWKGGGVNSFGFNSLLNYKANYKRDNHSWDNEIDLLYGMVNNTGQGYRKTMDRIFLDTKYGYKLSKNWDLIVSANVQTQFAEGFKYEKDSLGIERQSIISDIFAPAFITAALGFEYHPAPYFKMRLSPLAPRVTIVDGVQRFVTADNPKPYGVNPTKDARFEWYAFQMLAEFNKEIMKNMNLKIRYVMFANYQTLEFKKIDHRVDLNLVAKVNRFVNVSIGAILLSDYDQDVKVQLSQAFSLGILYSFQNYEDKKKD